MTHKAGDWVVACDETDRHPKTGLGCAPRGIHDGRLLPGKLYQVISADEFFVRVKTELGGVEEGWGQHCWKKAPPLLVPDFTFDEILAAQEAWEKTITEA